jgi:hypothetical protein
METREIIYIENFAGIKELTLPLRSINILIGPQASGKSVTIKLLYFFKNFVNEIIKTFETDDTRGQFDKKQKEKFITYFPRETWPKGNFKIQYSIDDFILIEVTRSKAVLKLSYSKELIDLFKKGKNIYKEEEKKSRPTDESWRANIAATNRIYELIKDELREVCGYSQLFVPAGRSFFSNIQSSIFSFLSENRSLDPFLIEFGKFYENFKRYAFNDEFHPNRKDVHFDKLVAQILNGTYSREKDKDFLVHEDLRKVNLTYASSGQQETFPLVTTLKMLHNIRFSRYGSTIYIEEPEAHLFPTAQKRIVQLLARTFNLSKTRYQFIITTHSPYILSSFNNLIEAGKLYKSKRVDDKKLFAIIPNDEIIAPELLVAYALNKGEKKTLIDGESNLIGNNILDSVSDEIAIEFGQLLDLEF